MTTTSHQTTEHDSATCTLGPGGGPCELCAWANQTGTEDTTFQPAELAALGNAVLERVHATLNDDSDDDFTTAWELAPSTMTRTTERECAEYWYLMGRRDQQAEEMMERNLRLRAQRKEVEQ